MPVFIKFHRYHHWDRGLAVIGFGADLVRTLVSMATKRSQIHIMGKCCLGNSNFIFYQILSKLAGNKDSHKILDMLDFGSILV